jgi:hypothetical protein
MEIHKLKRAQLFKKAEEDAADEQILRCGEVVTRSGIYEAIHHHHRSDEESGNEAGALIALRGEMVRPCHTCGELVCLRLVYAAPHISEDGDFASERTLSD